MTWVKQLELAISLGPTLVTVLFIVLFVGTLAWIYRPGSKHHYQGQSLLPLEDDTSQVAHPSRSEKPNG